MRAVRASITGGVQGVGYRWATRRLAVELGVAGWVRNRADGSVEVWVQGTEAAVDELLDFLHHGPAGAIVAAVSIDAVEPDLLLTGFEIGS
jgi:acylphosphatase